MPTRARPLASPAVSHGDATLSVIAHPEVRLLGDQRPSDEASYNARCGVAFGSGDLPEPCPKQLGELHREDVLISVAISVCSQNANIPVTGKTLGVAFGVGRKKKRFLRRRCDAWNLWGIGLPWPRKHLENCSNHTSLLTHVNTW